MYMFTYLKKKYTYIYIYISSVIVRCIFEVKHTVAAFEYWTRILVMILAPTVSGSGVGVATMAWKCLFSRTEVSRIYVRGT